MEHQKYMDDVYNYWKLNKNLTRKEACKHFGPTWIAAVIMGNFHYQINNGGVMQWADNGYMSEDLYELHTLFQKSAIFGISDSEKILDILKKINESCDGNADIVNAPCYEESETCWECHGNGEIMEYCSYCEGEGCNDCENGEVYVTCPECGGEGELREERTPFEDFCESVSSIDND